MGFFFYTLCFILFAQSLLALAAALRFARYALRAPAARHRYQPKAVVIVPCKGLDPGFEENIGALFAQDYRDYEIIFVTESEADPAYAVLNKLIKQSRRSAWLVVAGEAENCGQKIHNLRAALETLDAVNRRAEVLAFADSDARPTAQWLAELVAPLADESVGATSGFRWYLPADEKRAGFWSLLLSVWNASVLTLFGEKSAFAWGGAMAIRRENFERLDIRRQWAGAVSDDYVLTEAIKAAGQHVRFVPACLVATPASMSLREMLEFTTRQLTITRVYAPRIWRLTLLTHVLYNLTVWGSLLFLIATGLNGRPDTALIRLLVGILCLGAISAALRLAVAARLLEEDRQRITRKWWTHVFLGPLVSLVYLYNVSASVLTRRIVWRGVGYEMISSDQTAIWHREPLPDSAGTAQEVSGQRRARAHSPSSS
ncbi:MAG TPA: glycosyltransferase [Blastocatellia bacterium]|nr:glycosyltransferase [Blastocatellia bacterium]